MLVFKITGKNVSTYNRSTEGYEYIGEVDTLEQFYNKVEELESDDFFTQEDGRVLMASGNEAFDPKYPNEFDFVDYTYIVKNITIDDLDEYSDAHILRAINK